MKVYKRKFSKEGELTKQEKNKKKKKKLKKLN